MIFAWRFLTTFMPIFALLVTLIFSAIPSSFLKNILKENGKIKKA